MDFMGLFYRVTVYWFIARSLSQWRSMIGVKTPFNKQQLSSISRDYLSAGHIDGCWGQRAGE